MNTLRTISEIIAILFFVCYFYQFLYIPFALWRKDKKDKPAVEHRFAVLICARNEAAVIGDLLDSVRQQNYPQSLITSFVMADNCTDDTAEIARAHGAIVYTRFNQQQVGKGYALDALLKNIQKDYPNQFDGYFVFDADNVLSPDYVRHMNETFSQGYEIVTSYRNSKNYGDNWITSGYALWFLRESQYLNRARMHLGTSCAVSGTGFLFSQSTLDRLGGWPFYLLTEDIEFSVHHVLKDVCIGYCEQAELFDEQPTSFRQSWRQRTRWSKGYLQVFGRYGRDLIRGMIRGHFPSFDMGMIIMPAFILSTLECIVEIAILLLCLYRGIGLHGAVLDLVGLFAGMYLTLFFLGVLTTITEWDKIHTTPLKKIHALFTFPLFMFTYLPIALYALFAKAEWKPIEHKVPASVLNEVK